MEALIHGARNMVESKTLEISPKDSPPSCSSKASTGKSQSRDCSRKFTRQNYPFFTRSAVPVRVMYFGRDGSWVDFGNEVFGFIKWGFAERKPVIELKICELRYVFDFVSMWQIEVSSCNKRSIAWIDEKGGCFFPKFFVGEGFECDLLGSKRITIRIVSGGETERSIKRKREGVNGEKVEMNSSKRQVLISTDAVMSSRWPNVRRLKENERGYSVIRDKFLFAMKKVDPNVTVTSIHQCTRVNELAKARFDLFQKQLQVTNTIRGVSNVVCAWYGASEKVVENILLHGFGVPSKVSGPESYGIGAYLSSRQLPHLSAKFCEVDGGGEKHIVICRVILGNVEKLRPGSQQYFPSKVDFDTGTDDPKNPKWYIVWSCNMNRHIIPEFVVSFKSSTPTQGQMRESGHSMYTLNTLYSNVKSVLPPPKDQELVALCNLFKAGRLPKDAFIKKLREVVGDGLLLSTIRRIRGSH